MAARLALPGQLKSDHQGKRRRHLRVEAYAAFQKI